MEHLSAWWILRETGSCREPRESTSRLATRLVVEEEEVVVVVVVLVLVVLVLVVVLVVAAV